MNKAVIVGLVAILLASTTNGFAQKRQIAKSLSKAKASSMPIPREYRLARRVPGVYIPAGTTIGTLESKIMQTAQQAALKMDAPQASMIAASPERLAQFQAELGHPIFEGRPLPYKKGLAVLKANQEKFAAARANNEYEAAWEQFINERGYVDFHKGKSYGAPEDIANDVYNFYVKHIGTENLPRVRMVGVPEMEGVVCEIPVNGLSFVAPPPMDQVVDVPADVFVVLRTNSGRAQVLHRSQLDFEENGQNVGYYVLK